MLSCSSVLTKCELTPYCGTSNGVDPQHYLMASIFPFASYQRVQWICSRSLSISQIIISEGKIPIGTDHAKLTEIYCKVRNYYCFFKPRKESRSVGQFSNLARFGWTISTFLNLSYHSGYYSFQTKVFSSPKVHISWLNSGNAH